MISVDTRFAPCDDGVIVIMHHVPVIRAWQVPGSPTHPHWRCACGRELRNDTLLDKHVRSFHFTHACMAHGVATKLTPIRQVRSRERRARMPWRVKAPEYE
jgi:hypothetical protein